MCGKRTLLVQSIIMWIPCVWKTYIIDQECILWILGEWETYIFDEECIMDTRCTGNVHYWCRVYYVNTHGYYGKRTLLMRNVLCAYLAINHYMGVTMTRSMPLMSIMVNVSSRNSKHLEIASISLHTIQSTDL